MKKMLVCVALIASAATVNAQKFKVGLGGAFNSTWLMNKNVFDAADNLDIDMTFGGNFGLKVQYYFNDKVGLELGVQKAGHNQKYTGDVSSTLTYDQKVKLRYMEVPLLLRLGGDKGAYFEFGPQFSFLNKATETYELSTANPLVDYSDKDIKNNLNSTNIGILVGFGVDIDASESFTITAGLRLGYGFSDVTKKYSEAEATALLFSDNLSKMSADAHTDDKGNFKYKATNRLFGGLELGVLYTIPTGTKTAAK